MKTRLKLSHELTSIFNSHITPAQAKELMAKWAKTLSYQALSASITLCKHLTTTWISLLIILMVGTAVALLRDLIIGLKS